MAHQQYDIAHLAQLYSPGQLRQILERHMASQQDSLPASATDFMQQHGVGYIFGDLSQAMEDEESSQATSFQHSTPVLSASGPQIRQEFAASAFKPFTTSDKLAPQPSTYTFGDFTEHLTHVSETQEDCPEFDTASKRPNKQPETVNSKPTEPPIQNEPAKKSKRASKACKEPNVSTPVTPSSAAKKKGRLYK
jgi:hypothetical protein